MRPIVLDILHLVQHIKYLKEDPECYRPEYCCHCGRVGLWKHGSYPRKPDRQGQKGNNLNPIPILRFYCSQCHRTCSVLPECIPPRRWYLWAEQQAVLLLHLAGSSQRAISLEQGPSRSTIGRWARSLQERHAEFSSALKARFSELGYTASFIDFWKRCLKQMALSRAMYYLNDAQLAIP